MALREFIDPSSDITAFETLKKIPLPKATLFQDHHRFDEWVKDFTPVSFLERKGSDILDDHLKMLEVWNMADLESYVQENHKLIRNHYPKHITDLGNIIEHLGIRTNTFLKLCQEYNHHSYEQFERKNSKTVSLISPIYTEHEFYLVRMLFDSNTSTHPFIKSFYLMLPDRWISLIDTTMLLKKRFLDIHLSLYGPHTTGHKQED